MTRKNGPFIGPELVIGEFFGIRQFAITENPYLTGISYRQKWVNGVNTAVCWRDYGGVPDFYGDGDLSRYSLEAEKGEHVASRYCSCGFYSYFRAGNITQYEVSSNFALGIVKNWGRVTAGTTGFRASKAEIVGLWVPPDSSLRQLTLWDKFVGRLPTKEDPTSDPRTRAIKRNYPSPAYFDTPQALIAAFPLTVPPHVQ